ncbi:DUF453 domain protein [Cordyceps militaris CM01]|uniref:DUF453 domain protein n=1 Tax=Cordyceps militaris (strain CM01) TaxID=983644 RepID=G3JQ10_CORMM|nr:DUF453 domain protein [Cordyceps militaris CM01]EGX89261.1 DUF453 domain protein [Cordyceps militaris CM01]
MRPPPPPTTLLRRLRAPATTRRAVHTGLRSVPAWFVRGGTSNGLVLRAADLPPAGRWPLILPAVMGSPDAHHARQLDGMGSGVSSTSKLVVLSETTTTCDVAYTFVQIGIRDGAVDMAGNCGNMSSIVGPAAWDMGYVSAAAKASLVTTAADGTRWATVRLLNTNTDKVVESTFCVDGGGAYCPAGDYVMDGVPGAHSPVTMRFLDPAGAKTGRALPTGRAVDTLLLPDDDGRGCAAVRASLVDVGNPGVFVAGASVGLDAPVAPAAIEADAPLKARLEALRRQGAALMGMDPDTESVPKIVLVFPAAEDAAAAADLRCQAMSMGQAHKAVPLTLALCLGAAARIEGTLPWRMMRDAGRPEHAETVRIAHPSGLVDVGTTIVDGEIRAAKLLRTARVLMKGDVFY